MVAGLTASLVALALVACSSTSIRDAASDREATRQLDAARQWAERASRQRDAKTAEGQWLRCSSGAWLALPAVDSQTASGAATLASRCTDAFLAIALSRMPGGWSSGRRRFADIDVEVEFRGLSPYVGGAATLTRAHDVSMSVYGGVRHADDGFGVPLAMVAPRCSDRPVCKLVPPEGVFRWATAWIESERADAPLHLVIAEPLAHGPLRVGSRRLPLALDTSAFYARGVQSSRLRRLAILGLLGGREVGRRAGLYLLEDYDPDKRPVVMIHGLGSSPLAWARLSNALWGSPTLRSRFQVWHVVYQTDAPLLIQRRRVQAYLDHAWEVLDPDGDDAARRGIVLVGHSLGGVIARLLCADSGDALWSAAFTQPVDTLKGDAEDLERLAGVFHFQRHPGVTRAIFMAAPHHGTPAADAWWGRLFRTLVGRRAPEVRSLQRVARDNPDAIREPLRDTYRDGRLNSIATLQPSQPVRVAGESLLPAAGIPYHTIAGALPGRAPETDGYVPLASARLPGAVSTLVVPAGHDLYENDQAIAEVLRILEADLGL